MKPGSSLFVIPSFCRILQELCVRFKHCLRNQIPWWRCMKQILWNCESYLQNGMLCISHGNQSDLFTLSMTSFCFIQYHTSLYDCLFVSHLHRITLQAFVVFPYAAIISFFYPFCFGFFSRPKIIEHWTEIHVCTTLSAVSVFQNLHLNILEFSWNFRNFFLFIF